MNNDKAECKDGIFANSAQVIDVRYDMANARMTCQLRKNNAT